eukprot:TRINITY_DN12878_c0_g1_i17.p1 TRINITY_DN12878_c0_g1~~TRINITY_DN12878_c0_g1_i17.p1  ORF type:complete len:200 (+),score=61.93 TRINITY_DN12878_c0_g1_i17:56-655(+)
MIFYCFSHLFLFMYLFYIVIQFLLLFFFFFFKQKTAYEMLRSLVGSEMCIRDRIMALTDTNRPSPSWYMLKGVCYDVEEGDAGMAAAFAASFALCKQHSLRVLVTVSHSAPYAVPDKAALMAGFLQDSNIDYLSPQLYTSGRERENDFAFTADFPWTRYKGMKPALVPSIVRASLLPAAKAFFDELGISTQGFVQWAQA